MKTVKLLDIAKTVTPKTKIKTKDFLKAGKFPVVSQESDTINGYWDSKDDVMSFGQPVIVFGDHTRVVKYIDFDFVAGADGTKILEPSEELSPRYLYYWFLANPITGLGYARHFRILKERVIALPSLEDQKSIIQKLDGAFDKIDHAIELTQRNLNNVSKLFESLLNYELGKDDGSFDSKRLGDIFIFKNGRAFKKTEWSREGLPIIRIQNLKNPDAEFNYYEGLFSKEIEINYGDLLFSWSGTIGTSFGPHFWHGSKALLNQHIFKLSKLSPIYDLYAYFALKFITSEIEKQTHGAGGLVHVTKPTLENFCIPIPELEEQKRVADELWRQQLQVKKLGIIYQEKLAALEQLKQSMLKEAFRGGGEV